MKYVHWPDDHCPTPLAWCDHFGYANAGEPSGFGGGVIISLLVALTERSAQLNPAGFVGVGPDTLMVPFTDVATQPGGSC
jgi:hypothetical protein